MTVVTSALSALVAAASVTQLVQFGGRVLWDRDRFQASANIGVEGPLAGAGQLRFCVQETQTPELEEDSEHLFSDPWEPTLLGAAAGTAFGAGNLCAYLCCKRSVRRAREETLTLVQQHGRGALLRDARINGRQRLQALGAGELRPAVV